MNKTNEKSNADKIRQLKLFDNVNFADKAWTRVPGGLLVSSRPLKIERDPHGMSYGFLVAHSGGGGSTGSSSSITGNRFDFSSGIVRVELPDDYFDDFYQDCADAGHGSRSADNAVNQDDSAE